MISVEMTSFVKQNVGASGINYQLENNANELSNKNLQLKTTKPMAPTPSSGGSGASGGTCGLTNPAPHGIRGNHDDDDHHDDDSVEET